MPPAPTEIADFVSCLIAGALNQQHSPAQLDYDERMKRRDARRLSEGWTREQVNRGSRYVKLSQARTRPSDGQPVGSKHFDFDEYETRMAERKAADPESYQRERKARIEARRAMFDGYKEAHDFDNCNAELKPIAPYAAGWSRLHDIWAAIVQAELSQKLDRIHLDQASRIANVKNLERCQGRTRGIGAAARRAGY